MKVVVDTNVITAALWSGKKKTPNGKVLDLILKEIIESYSCDLILGETQRLFQTDEKLRKTNPQYLHARLDQFTEVSNLLRQIKLENARAEYGHILASAPQEDIYVILTAIVAKADAIITWDNKLSEWLTNNFKEINLQALTPEELIRRMEKH